MSGGGGILARFATHALDLRSLAKDAGARVEVEMEEAKRLSRESHTCCSSCSSGSDGGDEGRGGGGGIYVVGDGQNKILRKIIGVVQLLVAVYLVYNLPE